MRDKVSLVHGGSRIRHSSSRSIEIHSPLRLRRCRKSCAAGTVVSADHESVLEDDLRPRVCRASVQSAQLLLHTTPSPCPRRLFNAGNHHRADRCACAGVVWRGEALRRLFPLFICGRCCSDLVVSRWLEGILVHHTTLCIHAQSLRQCCDNLEYSCMYGTTLFPTRHDKGL